MAAITITPTPTLTGLPISLTTRAATGGLARSGSKPPSASRAPWNASCAISTVATACGYDGADAFRAWFRREFGMSPSEWQQRNTSSKARIE
ncbi:MAG: AraC family transcriptional regulator [Proteobacteria bacterium]|nr:AraC family transcriptional regulator [Pseudomonadota bacterium]